MVSELCFFVQYPKKICRAFLEVAGKKIMYPKPHENQNYLRQIQPQILPKNLLRVSMDLSLIISTTLEVGFGVGFER
jgi:hypothetical protein